MTPHSAGLYSTSCHWVWLWSKDRTILTKVLTLSTLTPLPSCIATPKTPTLRDMVYAGHIKRIPIQELKRLAGDELDEEDYKKIANKVKDKYSNDASRFNSSHYDDRYMRTIYGYDEYMVEVMDFEFIGVDCIYFEEKENRFGNKGFYFKGDSYKERAGSVFERTPHKMEMQCVYGGSFIVGTETLFGYGKVNNIPKNVHDISRANLSYAPVATNMLRMIPKSMVDSCTGFADMLQLTHLKIQQAIAKAKPDGLIIDIEGLENVQLGKGGESLSRLRSTTSTSRRASSITEARTPRVGSKTRPSGDWQCHQKHPGAGCFVQSLPAVDQRHIGHQ